MTTEQLEKALELNAKIEELEDQLKGWTDAKQWYHKTLNLNGGEGFAITVDIRYIDFDAVKNLTMASIKKELDELKQEFINL